MIERLIEAPAHAFLLGRDESWNSCAETSAGSLAGVGTELDHIFIRQASYDKFAALAAPSLDRIADEIHHHCCT